MPNAPAKFMHLFVFFDLPVTTRKKRQRYARFRRFLLKQGFDMLQYSVYCRLIPGAAAADGLIQCVRKHLPPEGSVRALLVTDQQYGRMDVMVGSMTEREKIVGSNQLILL